MRTWTRRAVAAALTAGGVGAAGGAGPGAGGDFRDWGDPGWPDRYNAAARAEVVAPFATQVNNGHVLNQTIWNWYFDAGGDKLNTAGMAKLDSLARERPGPDPRLYLQSARDVLVTPETMDKVGD